MRKKIVAGNWKMNLTLEEGNKLTDEVVASLTALSNGNEVIFAPPYLHLTNVISRIKPGSGISVAAQNCHHEANGAYTGEVSAPMLQNAGVGSVIIGHSERRQYNGETDELLSQKVNAAISAGLRVIFCCGEPLEIRDADTQNDYVLKQIAAGLFHLSNAQLSNIVIAYEPIWAIGTGRTASAQQAQDMHAHIRSVIAAQYGVEAANAICILYGGSCKPSNAGELFSCPDVDGGLIGGASLKADDFLGIIAAMDGSK
jgi:triosephosphate isomerase